jgi:hypothetical protein
MNLTEIRKAYPQYRIFESYSQPKTYFAIIETEVVRMEAIKSEYSNIHHRIPDSFTVKAFFVTCVNGFFEIADQNPLYQRINDLSEEVYCLQDKGIKA